MTVHPMGMFDVRQHAIPLETVITRVGASPVPEGQRRVHFGVPLVNGVPAGALSEVTDLFSAGVLPRSHRRSEAVAPELRADAGRRAHPSARRSAPIRRAHARRSFATRRSCATTTRCAACTARRAADVLMASACRRPRSPRAPPGAASCARARAMRHEPDPHRARAFRRGPGGLEGDSRCGRRDERRDVHARGRAGAGRRTTQLARLGVA